MLKLPKPEGTPNGVVPLGRGPYPIGGGAEYEGS